MEQPGMWFLPLVGFLEYHGKHWLLNSSCVICLPIYNHAVSFGPDTTTLIRTFRFFSRWRFSFRPEPCGQTHNLFNLALESTIILYVVRLNNGLPGISSPNDQNLQTWPYLGKKSHCRCDSVKNSKVLRSPWIIWVGQRCHHKCPDKRQAREVNANTPKGRWQCHQREAEGGVRWL